MGFADSVSLHGQQASLVPLSYSHHDNLVEALKDGELWTLWYTHVPTPDRLRAEIDRRLGLQIQGSMTPFAVIEKSTNEAVGTTTFMNIDAVNRRVEIGSSDGTLRDTCVYSILDREWPTVKAHLTHQLERS
jgi:N-acetyltransferase